MNSHGGTPGGAERMESNDVNLRGEEGLSVVECRNELYTALIRSGKMDMLKSHTSDLLRFSGWTGTMRESCTEYMQKEGPQNVNFSHMLRDLIPFGRAQVPPEVRESLKDLLHSFAQEHFTVIEDSEPISQGIQPASETYLPYVYQDQDKVPDYGDHSIFTQPPDAVLSPPESPTPPPASPAPRAPEFMGRSSPNNLSRQIGGIVLLDRVDLEKENEKLEKEKAAQREKEKAAQREKELKEKERQERDRIRQELERERLDRLERERQEQKERQRHEHTYRELQQPATPKERRERQPFQQSPVSVPSSPSTPRPEKKSGQADAGMLMKVTQAKQPLSLASTLITATAAIAGKKSKHINLNSDNEDDDEDDEELMDI